MSQPAAFRHAGSPPLAEPRKGEPAQILLTALALLEAQLRGHDAPPQAPTAVPVGGPVAGSRMTRLRQFFGDDFDSILEGVRIRHDLLQQYSVPKDPVESAAETLTAIAVRRGLVTP